MAKVKRGEHSRKSERDVAFERASAQYDAGKLSSAFRLFLTGACAGDIGAQLAVGNLYLEGSGVKRDRALALYWYRRAYRRGYAAAASNIGVVFRDEKKLARAVAWFERAVKLKDIDANLEIAKIYRESDPKKAARYLERVCKAGTGTVTEASREEALRLLSALR